MEKDIEERLGLKDSKVICTENPIQIQYLVCAAEPSAKACDFVHKYAAANEDTEYIDIPIWVMVSLSLVALLVISALGATVSLSLRQRQHEDASHASRTQPLLSFTNSGSKGHVSYETGPYVAMGGDSGGGAYKVY